MMKKIVALFLILLLPIAFTMTYGCKKKEEPVATEEAAPATPEETAPAAPEGTAPAAPEGTAPAK